MIETTGSENQNQWLREGPLTVCTPRIKKLSENFREKEIDLLFDIAHFIGINLKNRKPSKELLQKYHQKRSADQILKEGWAISCSDAGVVFCALSRARGIPTKYVQTVSIVSYLAKPRSPSGHVFCVCYIKDREYLVDPTRGFIWKLFGKFSSINIRDKKDKYVVAFEGLDNKSCGVANHKELIRTLSQVGKKWFKNHPSFTC